MGLTFVAVLLICTVTGVSIAGAIKSEKEREYWDTIGEDVKLLKDSNPDIWYALGFNNPPGSVTLGKNVTGDEGESDIYAWKNYTFSLSPTEMKTFADGILTGTKTLAEADWKNTEIGSNKVRDLKHEMFRAGLIELKNPRNSLSGFFLNSQGEMYLYQYASDWVKSETHLHKVDQNTTNPTPTKALPTPKSTY